MTRNEQIASIMLEAADLLKEDNRQTLNEGADPAVISLIGTMAAAVIGGLIHKHVVDRKESIEIAKQSIVIDTSELNKLITILNKSDEIFKKYCKQYNAERFLDKNVILPTKINKIDSDRQLYKKFMKTGLRLNNDLCSINFVALARNSGDYDKIIVSNDRIEEYVKKEMEILAKVVEAYTTELKKNKLIKEHCNIYINLNEGKSRANIHILSANFILKGSKYEKYSTKTYQEAIDILYEAAVLCEDAEKASSYIEKAEILQEAMSELDSF